MRNSIQRVYFSVFTFVGLVSLGYSQNTSPSQVADQFVKAWNAHDMKLFDKLFTDEAIWVPVAETMDKGKKSIIKDLREAHNTWAKATTLKHEAVTTQMISPMVATLFFHAHFIVDGKVIPQIERAMIFVVTKKSGRWQIASGQLTKQHDGA